MWRCFFLEFVICINILFFFCVQLDPSFNILCVQKKNECVPGRNDALWIHLWKCIHIVHRQHFHLCLPGLTSRTIHSMALYGSVLPFQCPNGFFPEAVMFVLLWKTNSSFDLPWFHLLLNKLEMFQYCCYCYNAIQFHKVLSRAQNIPTLPNLPDKHRWSCSGQSFYALGHPVMWNV